MDGLSWDASQLVENIPILWSTQPQDLDQIDYSMTNPCSSFLNYQMQEMMQKEQTNHLYPISEKVTSEIMSGMPNTNVSQREEAMTVKSGAGTSWEEPFTSQSCMSLSISNYVTDFNMAHQQKQQLINGTQNINASTTCSLESSLDCLLSTTNSNNTDTCVQDDGISMILSDCRNLWNFSAVSSGESESNARNKDMQYPPVNELDEIISQCPSDQHVSQGTNIIDSNVHCKKRNNELIKIAASEPCFSITENCGGFKLISENPPQSKKPRFDKCPGSSNINFQQPNSNSVSHSIEEPDPEALAQMKEMIYRDRKSVV